jgi:hypothetical protein
LRSAQIKPGCWLFATVCRLALVGHTTVSITGSYFQIVIGDNPNDFSSLGKKIPAGLRQ